MYSNEEVIQCEYVLYDDVNDLPQEKSHISSKPYNNDNSDSSDGDAQANKKKSDIKISKRSKPKCRQSRYDEDNYALPDPESDEEARSRKVDEQFKKVEDLYSFFMPTVQMALLDASSLLLGGGVLWCFCGISVVKEFCKIICSYCSSAVLWSLLIYHSSK